MESAHSRCQGESRLKTIGLAFLRPSWYNKNSLDGGQSAPLRWLCGIQGIMRTFSRPLTDKRRLPRKPTYRASNQAASQGRCVNGLTPLGDGNMKMLLINAFFISCVNGLTPLGDGNLFIIILKGQTKEVVLMALPH
mgnify:CR=1 FL=1